MNAPTLDIVFIGLSLTSSWGNGHATTYRGLIRELNNLGHRVTFLEHDKPWYANNRDFTCVPYCQTILYQSVEELQLKYEALVAQADVVIVGSYVPEGVKVGNWVCRTTQGIKAFYDIDTPVTLAKLDRGDYEYLHPGLISTYDLYLSFTGGPTLERLEKVYGSPMARPLYCAVDPTLYYPEEREKNWDLGYLGTYSPDRQPPLDKLMLAPARQHPELTFVVAGPQYPVDHTWAANVERIEHLPPAEHRYFYNAQRFTLNITRADMIAAGYSPSVRLFEAAACGTPIISDEWEGLDSFFEFDKEILVARSGTDTVNFLLNISEDERMAIGERARQRVLGAHTAAHRAEELELYLIEVLARKEAYRMA